MARHEDPLPHHPGGHHWQRRKVITGRGILARSLFGSLLAMFASSAVVCRNYGLPAPEGAIKSAGQFPDRNRKRQRTAALQNLAAQGCDSELAKLLECGGPLPLWLDRTMLTGSSNHTRCRSISAVKKNFEGRYIVTDPKICHGQPTFRGTRILVADVLEQVASGMAWESITEEWRGSITSEAIAEAVRL